MVKRKVTRWKLSTWHILITSLLSLSFHRISLGTPHPLYLYIHLPSSYFDLEKKRFKRFAEKRNKKRFFSFGFMRLKFVFSTIWKVLKVRWRHWLGSAKIILSKFISGFRIYIENWFFFLSEIYLSRHVCIYYFFI